MAYQNFFAAKLYNDIGSSDTTITLDIAPAVASGRMVLEARNPTMREMISYSGVDGNQLTGVVRGIGGTTAKAHTRNAIIQMNLTAEDLNDIYTAFNTFSATNGSGWYSMATSPTLQASNGQREYVLKYSGQDLTGVLQPGTKLKIPRTIAPPTKSGKFINASSQYASKTGATGFTFTDDFTCEAWVYLDSYTGASMHIVTRYDGTNGFEFRINDAGSVMLVGRNGGSGNHRYVASVQSVPLRRWVHIAATLDMSGWTAATNKVFMDGVEVPANLVSLGSNPTSLVQAGNLMIGGTRTGIERFDGNISEVRVWSHIRTAAQVRNNARIQLVGNEAGLVGYWKLNGNFNDSTANANHLTAAGGAVATYSANPFSSNEYAIVTAVNKVGADTNVTVFCPQGGGVPNETLGTTSYSSSRAPFGFPANKTKWDISYLFKLSLSGSASTLTNLGTIIMTVATGEWLMRIEDKAYTNRASGGIVIDGALSEVNNAVSHAEMAYTLADVAPVTDYTGFVTVFAPYETSTQRALYLLHSCGNGTMWVRGDKPGGIKLTAECAYL